MGFLRPRELEQGVTLLSSVQTASARADRVDAEDETKAKKQRRKMQNRKNQRAHRLRTKGHSPEAGQTALSLHITRWRLDEVEIRHDSSQSSSSIPMLPPLQQHRRPRSILAAGLEHKGNFQGLKPIPSAPRKAPPTPPPFTFPLSTDHLLHLVQYNVFRAFVANKQILNLVLKGWTKGPSSDGCPISGPYRDDTMIYPLNPNVPAALVPTRFQQAQPHAIWINFLPFPRLRDNLIRNQVQFDQWEFLRDLIGALMGTIPIATPQGLPITINLSNPQPPKAVPLTEEYDDEVTTGRKGLVVWGEPYDKNSWEGTPGFFAKWWWAIEGCDELLESSNRWRIIRGEEPIRLFK